MENVLFPIQTHPSDFCFFLCMPCRTAARATGWTACTAGASPWTLPPAQLSQLSPQHKKHNDRKNPYNNNICHRTSVSAESWLLYLLYVIFIFPCITSFWEWFSFSVYLSIWKLSSHCCQYRSKTAVIIKQHSLSLRCPGNGMPFLPLYPMFPRPIEFVHSSSPIRHAGHPSAFAGILPSG